MKPVIEKLLSDMIHLDNNRKLSETDENITSAYENLGDEITFTRIRNLLSWIDPKFHVSTTDLEKYLINEDFMDHETFLEVYDEFKSLFDHILVFDELFELKEEHIEFNPKLSKTEIEEIREYVKENNIIKYRSRHYRPD